MNRLITFWEFWDAYGLKRDRLAAQRAWNKLKKKDRRAAFNGIAAYREDCYRRGIAMMYAQGYLSHRRWEDEPSAGPVGTQQPEPGGPSGSMEKW